MKVRNTIITVLLAAGGIAMAVPLATQARPLGDMEGCEHPRAMQAERDGMPRLFKRLDLSDAQKAQLEQLRQRDAAVLAEKFKTMRDSRAQLRDMRIKGEYDAAKIKALTERGAMAMAEMGQLRARQMHEMAQILTPEQRQQVEAKREKMLKRWQERHGERPDRG